MTTGNVGGPSYPDFRQLGYRCRRRDGYEDCAINFYVSERTGRLESFMTSSPRFSLFGGVHVGMPADLASRRERKPNLSGCGQLIAVSTPQMSIDVDTVGGRRDSRGHVSGGRVSAIEIDQRPYGVGLLFC